MTTTIYHGYQGSVRFHPTGGTASALTRVTSWSLSVRKQVVTTTRIGDTYEKNAGTLISGSGKLELIYDGSNTDLITAINRIDDPGNAAFELYLDTAGNKRISFAGLIDNAEYGTTVEDVQRISCTFVTNGTITLNI